MKVIDCHQYSPEWWAARRGVPTASEFGNILTPKTGKLAAAAESYICRLIGDTLDLEYPRLSEGNEAMRRGTGAEPESRRWYEMEVGVPVQQVGFCLSDDGRFGCSPDGLVGSDGLLELKNPLPHTHVKYLLDGGLPDEYRAQVHGQLIVTGRQWCDFVSYAPGLPSLVLRVTPDEYTEKLAEALEQFYAMLHAAWLKIRSLDLRTEAA